MLIDSIMGTIDHIYCDNTFHVITEQNHQRNTIVPRATRGFPLIFIVENFAAWVVKFSTQVTKLLFICQV